VLRCIPNRFARAAPVRALRVDAGGATLNEAYRALRTAVDAGGALARRWPASGWRENTRCHEELVIEILELREEWPSQGPR
jgi:hypothetical protein